MNRVCEWSPCQFSHTVKLLQRSFVNALILVYFVFIVRIIYVINARRRFSQC